MQIDELPSYTIIAAATNHPELLDRAAWRRFQVRLNLPLPTQKELARYIEVFMSSFEEPISQSPIAIAKALGNVSYADAEQFCIDVRRRHVLSMGHKPLGLIIGEQLNIWTSKTRAKGQMERGEANADAPTASSSES
jgi:hypothetical protein